MVHSHDSQSISQSIVVEDAKEFPDVTEIIVENINTVSEESETVTADKREEENVAQNFDFKSDCNDSNSEKKSTSQKGSESFILVQSGDSSR